MMKILKKAREDKRLLILSKRRKTIKKAEDKILKKIEIEKKCKHINNKIDKYNIYFEKKMSRLSYLTISIAVFSIVFTLLNLSLLSDLFQFKYYYIMSMSILSFMILISLKVLKITIKYERILDKMKENLEKAEENKYKTEDNHHIYFNEILKLRKMNKLHLVDQSIIYEVLNERREQKEVKETDNDNILNNFLNTEHLNLLDVIEIKEPIEIT